MLLPIQIQSANIVTGLLAGVYAVKCSVFVERGGSRSVVYFEYERSGSGSLCAVDALFLDGEGNARMSDFAFLPDGIWRDSFGVTATSLDALLPQEVANYVFAAEFNLPDVSVGGGNAG
ncbi:hypothetical protein DBB29_24855 [Pandoraea cepalis]|uniref:Uncharacterized protein n=1 Tax=Pandoraea cepalis TaxID=2508294 RepID=A0AAW7MGN0_9BURK|nr:hypothetical protein [Pandoraea cepalis]MDN4571892.1 hypothetical protein [Pandoraea cepalis]MDN4581346.1 hypothetical protein [Pandoraea cepalis]